MNILDEVTAAIASADEARNKAFSEIAEREENEFQSARDDAATARDKADDAISHAKDRERSAMVAADAERAISLTTWQTQIDAAVRAFAAEHLNRAALYLTGAPRVAPQEDQPQQEKEPA